MDFNHLDLWVCSHISTCKSSWRRGDLFKAQLFLLQYERVTFTLKIILQVTYSQSLGVIGYCLLPMTIVAAILPFTYSYYYPSLVLKV